MIPKPTRPILKYLVISLLMVSSAGAYAFDTNPFLEKKKEVFLDSLASSTNSRGSNYFNIDESCSEEQYHQLVAAIGMVFMMSNLATHENCEEHGYQKWFDDKCDAQIHRRVKEVYSQISDNLNKGNIGLVCEELNTGHCSKNKLIIAYTRKNQPLVWVCNANFFEYPIVVDRDSEEDTTISVLTHEFSHNLGNTDDHVFGPDGSRKLDREQRIKNADNYGYYINYLMDRENPSRR